jgi:hypothetical protein
LLADFGFARILRRIIQSHVSVGPRVTETGAKHCAFWPDPEFLCSYLQQSADLIERWNRESHNAGLQTGF